MKFSKRTSLIMPETDSENAREVLRIALAAEDIAKMRKNDGSETRIVKFCENTAPAGNSESRSGAGGKKNKAIFSRGSRPELHNREKHEFCAGK
jgi:hypothetical protein